MSDLSRMLSEIRHVVLDMDGTVYLGETLFPCTLPFLDELQSLGIDYSFMTNNNSRSRAEYVELLGKLGIAAGPADLLTSNDATVGLLRRSWPEVRTLFVLGTPACCADFAAAGFSLVDRDDEKPDAVVVAFDTTLTYARLARAASWIVQRPIPYIATHPDRVCPNPAQAILPDCGSICALLAAATGRDPDAIAGKPNPALVQEVAAREHLDVLQLAVVGDRLYTDMRMARDAGAVSVLVLSGEATRDEAEAATPQPDLIVADVGEFGQLLREARELHRPKQV